MKARSLFDVRAGEGGVTLRAFLALFGVTTAHTLIETARDALFLARIPATQLPILYLSIAAVGILTTRASLASAGRAAGVARDSVAVSMVGAAVVTALFWAAAASPTVMVLYALFIFSGMFAGWVAGQLWLRFGALFTVQQAKRLYGAIGTGAVLGAVVGSAVARAALAFVPVRHLLLGAALVLLATAAGPARLGRAHAPLQTGRRRVEEERARSLGGEIATVTKHPYLARLLALTLLAATVSTAIDYLFKRQIAASIEPAKLGAFIASVALATNLASLVAQAIGVGLAVRWLGVHRALYVVPVLLALGAGATVGGGGLVAILMLRGTDGALRYSLHKTTFELLFVPLPDALRARSKPVLELLGQRGGQAVASVGILVLGLALSSDRAALAVAAGVLVATIAWLWLAYDIRPRYLDVFRDTLRKGRVAPGEALPELDLSALETLIAALSSRRDGEVLGALDLLAAQRRARLVPSLILYHPSPSVVLRGLEILVEEGRTDFVDIADRLLEHADADVCAAALRARIAARPDVRLLTELLESPREELRATAFVALTLTGEIEPNQADCVFSERAGQSISSRRALASALSVLDIDESRLDASRVTDLTTLAAQLARDPDTETRQHAARALGALGSPTAGALLLELLADRSAGLAAMHALAEMGEKTVSLLEDTLNRHDVTPEVRWRVVGALARSEATRALPILVDQLTTTTDTALRARLLRALRSKQASGVPLPIRGDELESLARNTVEAIAHALAYRLAHARLVVGREDSLGTTAGAELLQRLLRDRESESTDILFTILAILYPRENVQRIQRGLESADAKARASARELTENVIRRPLRDPILALADEIDDDTRLARIGTPRTELAYEALIEQMIAEGGVLGAVAVFHAGELGLRVSKADFLATMGSEGAALARDLSAPTLASVSSEVEISG